MTPGDELGRPRQDGPTTSTTTTQQQGTRSGDDAANHQFQFLPRLTDEEYRSLEDSIREHGIQVPILVDENRTIIDGHHRKEIAERLGLECPRRFAMDLTDPQKRTLALSLNLARRHLTREQKRSLVEASVKADPELSDRQHAERTGVDHHTVAVVRAPLESTGEIPQSTTRTSADGRERPSTQPERVDREAITANYIAKYPELAHYRDNDKRVADIGQSLDAYTPTERITRLENLRKVIAAELRREAEPPKPARRKRPPLPDAYRDAVWDLRRRVVTLDRLTEDDRFPTNRPAIAAMNRGDLERISKMLSKVRGALEDEAGR